MKKKGQIRYQSKWRTNNEPMSEKLILLCVQYFKLTNQSFVCYPLRCTSYV